MNKDWNFFPRKEDYTESRRKIIQHRAKFPLWDIRNPEIFKDQTKCKKSNSTQAYLGFSLALNGFKGYNSIMKLNPHK